MAVLILCQMVIQNKKTLASGTCHLPWIELLLLSKFPVWPVHGWGESSPQSQRGQKPITQIYGIATTSSNKPGCCSGHGKWAGTCLNSALQSCSWEGFWYPAQRSDEERRCGGQGQDFTSPSITHSMYSAFMGYLERPSWLISWQKKISGKASVVPPYMMLLMRN